MKDLNTIICLSPPAFHLQPPGFEIWGSMPTMKSTSLCSQSLFSLCSQGQHLLNSWAAPEPCSHQGQAAEQGPARWLLKVWQPQCPARHCCFMCGKRLALGFLQMDSVQQCESEAMGMQWLSRGVSLAEITALPSCWSSLPSRTSTAIHSVHF